MESRAISDEQISASSLWTVKQVIHGTNHSRLNFKGIGGKAGAWTARAKDLNQWLQVDLGNAYTTVTRVATQGRNGWSQWVTKYKLQYSNDDVNFKYFKDQGQTTDKVKQTFFFICLHTISCKLRYVCY